MRAKLKRLGAFWWVAMIAWFIVNAARTGLSAPISLLAYAIVDVILIVLAILNWVI